jgi:plastocyanin
MLRTRLAFVALLGAALVIVASASAAVPTLKATDGPGFTISLKKGTTKVTKLKAGKYKIVVKDLSNIHNFHLTGPGVNKKTGVGPKGTFTWTGTLKKGTYKYICDPHAAIMKGSFKVT